MSNIRIFATTFNCGKIPPHTFPEHVSQIHPRHEHYDIYAFAFQEMNPLLLQTDYIAASNTLSHVSISLLNIFGRGYTVLAKSHIGQIGLVIIVRDVGKVSNLVKSSGFPCGHLGTSLKGATGVRFQYDGCGLTFLSLHLNAGEKRDHLMRRLEDVDNIMRLMKFEDGQGILVDNYQCFMMGDFNFRCTGGHGLVDAESAEDVVHGWRDFERSSFLSHARKYDELKMLMDNDGLLANFEEADIEFEPSYKKVFGKNELVTTRIPSYCDRILFTKSEPKVTVLKYSTPNFAQDSDHSMVYLICEIRSNSAVKHRREYTYTRDGSQESYEEIVKRSHSRDSILAWLIYVKETTRGKLLVAGIVITVSILYHYLF